MQVITTTHSPYMLSMTAPQSNVLLERKSHRGRHQQTERVPVDGQNWMEPFSQALGIDSESFRPWRNLIFGRSERVLLVEGDTDRGYFELLQGSVHGAGQLLPDVTLFSYGGKDNIKNSVMLRYIRGRTRAMFVTFDLDVRQEVERHLSGLGLEVDKDYCSIGIDSPGRRRIEGLLPEDLVKSVHSANTSLVQALSGTPEERRSADSRLKKALLEEVRQRVTSDPRVLSGFYPLVKKINKAIQQAV